MSHAHTPDRATSIAAPVPDVFRQLVETKALVQLHHDEQASFNKKTLEMFAERHKSTSALSGITNTCNQVIAVFTLIAVSVIFVSLGVATGDCSIDSLTSNITIAPMTSSTSWLCAAKEGYVAAGLNPLIMAFALAVGFKRDMPTAGWTLCGLTVIKVIAAAIFVSKGIWIAVGAGVIMDGISANVVAASAAVGFEDFQLKEGSLTLFIFLNALSSTLAISCVLGQVHGSNMWLILPAAIMIVMQMLVMVIRLYRVCRVTDETRKSDEAENGETHHMTSNRHVDLDRQLMPRAGVANPSPPRRTPHGITIDYDL
jgi:hypothetical protein